MAERAAHLVDAALPRVPVRQWVLTMPYRLRYRMARDHGLSRAVLGVYTRVLLDVYARGARERGVRGGRTGTVTVMQRAGSGVNANLHFHTLALATVRHRLRRLLIRRGLEPSDDTSGPADRFAEESPLLARVVGASVQGRVALGPRAGTRVRRLGRDVDLETVTSRGPRQAQLEGFDLHANVWVSANNRAGLERLCR
jgi:hypothetical protein